MSYTGHSFLSGWNLNPPLCGSYSQRSLHPTDKTLWCTVQIYLIHASTSNDNNTKQKFNSAVNLRSAILQSVRRLWNHAANLHVAFFVIKIKTHNWMQPQLDGVKSREHSASFSYCCYKRFCRRQFKWNRLLIVILASCQISDRIVNESQKFHQLEIQVKFLGRINPNTNDVTAYIYIYIAKYLSKIFMSQSVLLPRSEWVSIHSCENQSVVPSPSVWDQCSICFAKPNYFYVNFFFYCLSDSF